MSDKVYSAPGYRPGLYGQNYGSGSKNGKKGLGRLLNRTNDNNSGREPGNGLEMDIYIWRLPSCSLCLVTDIAPIIPALPICSLTLPSPAFINKLHNMHRPTVICAGIGVMAGVCALDFAYNFVTGHKNAPGSHNPAWAEATRAYLRYQNCNPIFGESSKKR